MAKLLKVGIVQQQIRHWNVQESVERAKDLCAKLKNDPPDIVCFPELLPGSASDTRCIAMELGSYVIAGSLPKTAAGRYKNRATVIRPDGSYYGSYDKQALLQKERSSGLIPGEDVQVFATENAKFSILICADLPLLPEASTHATLKGSELIFVPALAVKPLLPFLEMMLIARSMDNGLPIVFVNCAGSFQEEKIVYGGGKSKVVVPIPTQKGVSNLTELHETSSLYTRDNIQFEAEQDEGVYIVEIDLAKFERYRNEILEMRRQSMNNLSKYLITR